VSRTSVEPILRLKLKPRNKSRDPIQLMRDDDEGATSSSNNNNNNNNNCTTPRNTMSTDASAIFLQIPDDALLWIAQYAAPPDIYNLCLTSRHFFRADTGNAASKKKATSKKKAKVNRAQDVGAKRGGGGNAPGALLATKLLRSSLLSNLR
jgi:hypothetical protein